jgi:uncharacterized membrane protein
VNSGFLHGCVCPIYGIGGLMLTALMYRVSDSRTLFMTGAIVCSVLEYAISWFLEYAFGKRWWDYSDWPLNIHGRVCAVSMVGFGFASLIGTKLIIPSTLNAIERMGENQLHMTAFLLAVLLAADLLYTLHNMDNEGDKLWFIEEHSQMMEKHSDDLEKKLENIKRIIKR